MQKQQYSPLAVIWVCNLILLFTYAIGGPSLSFLKSSVLEYNNVASDPFDGAISPIAYVPDWSRPTNTNKTATFESFDITAFIDIPEYNAGLLGDTLQKSTSLSVLRYEYPVVYMGSYRGNYVEYDGSHCWVDIRAPLGTPVLATANGVVVKVKDDETGDGKYVIIRHDNVDIDWVKQTVYSWYEHLSEIIAVEGTKISRGEILGKVGMTGITTTPHLHFQIDKSTSPFHMYWPYTFKQAADLSLDFFGAINVGLGKESAIRYTIHPMDFIKNHQFLGSAPKEVNITAEVKKDPIVLSSEIVADATDPAKNGAETVVPKAEVTHAPTVPIKMVEITPTTPAFTPDNTHIFSDIPTDSPFYTATKYLSTAGIAHGYEDGGFHPNDRISRSEAILLYDRLFHKGEANTEINLPFLDVLPSNELTQALTRAFTQKIVVNSNYFRPNDSLTRAEAVTLLVRTSAIPLDTSKSSLFKDVKIKSSHAVYINTFAKYLGVKGESFEPNKDITRGELAKILYLFDQKKNKESN